MYALRKVIAVLCFNLLRTLRSSVALALVLSSLLGLFGAGDMMLAQSAPTCQPGPPPEPLVLQPSELQPNGLGTLGGRLTLANPASPRTLNPFVASDDGSQAVIALLHESLLGPNLQEGVARLKDLSEDQTVITLELRRGLCFSDGQPVTIADLLFSLEVALAFNPEAWQIPDPQDPTQLAEPLIEQVDERTIRLTLPQLFLPLFKNLARLPILPKHLLGPAALTGKEVSVRSEEYRTAFTQAWGIGTLPDQYAGLGPFRLKKRLSSAGDATLERNPFYWKVDPQGAQLPYLDGVELQVITDGNVRVTQFQQGKLDALKILPQDMPALVGQSAVQVVLQLNFTDTHLVAFNQDVDDPNLRRLFRDERFRKAISLAIDRQQLLNLNLAGFGQIHCGPGVPPDVAIDIPCEFDVAQAAALLDEVGLKATNGDGVREFPADFPDPGQPVRFTVLTVQGSDLLVNDAQIIAQDLQKLGLEVNVDAIDPAALEQRLQTKRYQAARVTLRSEGSFPELRAIWDSCGRRHIYRFSDCSSDPGHRSDEVPDWQLQADRLLIEQALGPTQAERKAKLAEFQQVLAEHVPVVFLYRAPDIQAFFKDRVGNFSGLLRGATLLRSEIVFRKDL